MAVALPHGLLRAARMTAMVLVLIVLAGATYQGVATALERHRYPRPGRLVDVGDHQLHLFCVGKGTPVVVLEAPATAMSAAWGLVQPQVAMITRTCSYDRAGLGWSEAGDGGYSPARVPDELHTLLTGAREHAPYVIVGEGLGGAFARMYASRYEATVAALVTIDTPDPAASSFVDAKTMRLVSLSPWLARVGILRATNLLSRRAAGLPPASAGPMRAFLNRPDHLTRSAQELARWDETMQLAGAAPLGSRLVREDLTVAGQAPVRYLTDADGARRVAETIIAIVRRVRAAS